MRWRGARTMRSSTGPRSPTPNPRLVPAYPGTADARFEAEDDPRSPVSPVIRQDIRTVREEDEKRDQGEGDRIRASRALRECSSGAGETGDLGEEGSSEALNLVPGMPGTDRGHRGPLSGPPPGWSCPVWFERTQTLPPTSDPSVHEATAPPDLPPDVADWPEEWREIWEERSAIAEFDGALPREEAERLAEERVRLECARSREVPGGGPS